MEKNKELKEVLSLVVGLVNAGIDASKDGKINMADLGDLVKVFPKVKPAFDGIGEVPSEISALTSEDAADLVSHVATSLEIEDEKAKVIIDKSLKAIIAVYELVKVI